MYPLRVAVTMSLHKLTAGSGYDYLTRQVAALDATEKGHTGLAAYYTERGETPGVAGSFATQFAFRQSVVPHLRRPHPLWPRSARPAGEAGWSERRHLQRRDAWW